MCLCNRPCMLARCMSLEFYLQFTFEGNALYAHLNQNANFNDDVNLFFMQTPADRLVGQAAGWEGPMGAWLIVPSEGRKYCAIAHPAGAKIAPTGLDWTELDWTEGMSDCSCGMQQPAAVNRGGQTMRNRNRSNAIINCWTICWTDKRTAIRWTNVRSMRHA